VSVIKEEEEMCMGSAGWVLAMVVIGIGEALWHVRWHIAGIGAVLFPAWLFAPQIARLFGK
jgi:hypothetical protein